MAAGYSSAAVTMGHLALKRTIRHAEANDLVSRNVATLADTPQGPGRPAIEVADPRAGRGGHHRRQDPAGDGTAAGLKNSHRPAAQRGRGRGDGWTRGSCGLRS
jgi:hypothetical protein